MKPNISDYLTSSARWRLTHRGVQIEVSHHGVSDYSPEGTWCYYLLIDQRMFQRAADWALFDYPTEVTEFGGRFREHFPYENLPDLEWHGEATFGERNRALCPDTREDYAWIKVGCDYAHLFDRERGFPDTLATVSDDARRSADYFCDRFPQNERCSYSGKIGHPSQFYTAVNGNRVHFDSREKASEWPTWKPADDKAIELAEASQ